MTDFGLLLKTLRSNANLTQQALAHQIGIKNGAISKWERGESFPDIFAIRKLSDILNVSCDELLHPTDTLAKMNTNTSDRNPDICEAITLNEAMEDNIPAKDASPAPLPIPFFSFYKEIIPHMHTNFYFWYHAWKHCFSYSIFTPASPFRTVHFCRGKYCC